MTSEKLEIYTKEGKPTGVGKNRNEVHRDGDWHGAIKVWLINPNGEILLQQRSFNKESFPGMWDSTCAGHISFGDDALGTCVKELEEELGIKATEKDFQFIKRIFYSDVLNEGKFFNNEYSSLYLVEKEVDLKDLKLQKSEVHTAKFVHWKELEEMMIKKDQNLILNDEYLDIFKLIRSKNYK